jgi:hypothetical protein
VSGGSAVNLLALWRVHGLDTVLHAAWQAGTVLMGVSAGSLCWHIGGTTDSFGLPLRPVTDALGWLPYSNSPHHNAEPERRPLIHRLISDGTLPDGYATDNGAGLVYRGTELYEAVSERSGALATRSDGTVTPPTRRRYRPACLPEPSPPRAPLARRPPLAREPLARQPPTRPEPRSPHARPRTNMPVGSTTGGADRSGTSTPIGPGHREAPARRSWCTVGTGSPERP